MGRRVGGRGGGWKNGGTGSVLADLRYEMASPRAAWMCAAAYKRALLGTHL